MKILILGASGLVGGNMLRYFKTQPDTSVIGTHFSFETPDTVPFNTLEPELSSNFNVLEFNPDVIINCGALTWVDYCEEHPDESYLKTVTSTKNTLALAKQCNAKYLYIGTDYVFDGTNGPYTELASVNPVNIYGKHKLEAENLVFAQSNSYLSLRITNVYGHEIRNKNFVSRLFENAHKPEAQEIKLPFDQYATPVNAFDIARAAYLLLRDNKQGIYNIAATDFVNRVQLAHKVLQRVNGHQITIVPVDTKTFNPPAMRPLTGGLISAKFLSEYPDFDFSCVDDFVTELVQKTPSN